MSLEGRLTRVVKEGRFTKLKRVQLRNRLSQTLSDQHDRKNIVAREIAYFRWRIFPAFASLGLSCAVAIVFYNNVVIGKISIVHPAHFLIFVSGAVWILGSLLWFCGNWRLATAATLIGFVLPFLRPIF